MNGSLLGQKHWKRGFDDDSKDCNQRLTGQANMRIQIMPSGLAIKAEQLKA